MHQINHNGNSESPCVGVCGVSYPETVQLVTSLMTPAKTHQWPHCVPQPLLGTHRQRQQGEREM